MVDKHNNQGSIDRQYLKSMGIDLWVDRDSSLAPVPQAAATANPAPVAVTATGSTPASSSPASAGVKPAHRQLAELAAPELATTVAELKVSCTEPGRPAELLVVTEGSDLSADCTKLLQSMFKAIEFDRQQWLHAGISRAPDAVPISQLQVTVNPKALVLMIKTGGNATALQSVRGLQHHVASLTGFMVVSFHPQDLLDNPETKRPAWEDLKQLRQWLSTS